MTSSIPLDIATFVIITIIHLVFLGFLSAFTIVVTTAFGYSLFSMVCPDFIDSNPNHYSENRILALLASIITFIFVVLIFFEVWPGILSYLLNDLPSMYTETHRN